MDDATMTTSPLVLIVEDEWVIAAYLQQLLEEAGYHIHGPAACVGYALQLLDQNPPNVALLDVSLRGERSFELARALRERSIPFAFMTGYLAGDIPEDLRNNPTIGKPIDNDVLLACIGNLLQVEIADRSAAPTPALENCVPTSHLAAC